MSKMQELIRELCPEGVEWKRMDEVFEMKNGYTPSKANQEFWDNGDIPWFRMEDIRQNGRILSDSIQHITKEAVKGGRLFPANSFIMATTATIGEHALIIVDSQANQQFTNLTIRKSLIKQIHVKYLFYYLFIVGEWCKNNTNVSGFASVDMKKFKKLEIPLPPLEVQNEIVRILDAFTEHAAELQAELQARKEQYEYYRNKLLTFDENDESVKFMRMEEVGKFTRGKRFVRTDIVDEGIPCIHYGDIYTYYGLTANQTRGQLRADLAPKMRYAQKNDIIIVAAGENKDDIGVGLAWLGEKPAAVHDACFIFQSNMWPQFVTHYLRTKSYHKQIKKYVSEAKICSISAKGLGNAIIPVPSIEKQQQIAFILDKFESLVNDLSEGLPAEIAAVQEQYEYYRNKLLTFKRKS